MEGIRIPKGAARVKFPEKKMPDDEILRLLARDSNTVCQARELSG